MLFIWWKTYLKCDVFITHEDVKICLLSYSVIPTAATSNEVGYKVHDYKEMVFSEFIFIQHNIDCIWVVLSINLWLMCYVYIHFSWLSVGGILCIDLCCFSGLGVAWHIFIIFCNVRKWISYDVSVCHFTVSVLYIPVQLTQLYDWWASRSLDKSNLWAFYKSSRKVPQ